MLNLCVTFFNTTNGSAVSLSRDTDGDTRTSDRTYYEFRLTSKNA